MSLTRYWLEKLHCDEIYRFILLRYPRHLKICFYDQILCFFSYFEYMIVHSMNVSNCAKTDYPNILQASMQSAVAWQPEKISSLSTAVFSYEWRFLHISVLHTLFHKALNKIRQSLRPHHHLRYIRVQQFIDVGVDNQTLNRHLKSSAENSST